MATKQFLQGVETVYINGILVPTTEEISYTLPTELYKYAESNQGPLGGVLVWSKEPGTLGLSFLHYSGLSYVDMFNDIQFFEISIYFRSGDLLSVHNAILNEKPNFAVIAGSTEASFSSLNMELTLAS